MKTHRPRPALFITIHLQNTRKIRPSRSTYKIILSTAQAWRGNQRQGTAFNLAQLDSLARRKRFSKLVVPSETPNETDCSFSSLTVIC